MKLNDNSTLKEIREYIRANKLNKPELRLGMKKAELITILKKLGHWDSSIAKKKKTRKLARQSTVVKVPDKAKGSIPQVKKNLTPYGKQADAAEPDTVSKASVKRDWTIISDNCYGVAYMKALNKPYESPFFSMFIYAPDYITLLENFDEYMKIKPVAQKPVGPQDKFGGKSKYRKVISKYPVLLLKGSKGDVELHYAHEKQSAEKAIEKWVSRSKRMSKNKKDMFVKMDDRDKFSVELGKRFLNLKQFPHKRLFVSQKYKSSLGGKKDVIVMDFKSQGPIGTKTEKLYPIPAK